MDKNCCTCMNIICPNALAGVACDHRCTCVCSKNSKQYDFIDPMHLLQFCVVPRTRREIERFLKCENTPYVRVAYVKKLLAIGLLKMTIPHAANSKYQRYFSVT